MMVLGAITDWWHVALLAGPMVVVVALLCRLLPCRPATRHLMWLTVLAFMLCVPLLPAAPSAGEFQTRTEIARSAAQRLRCLAEPCLSVMQAAWLETGDTAAVPVRPRGEERIEPVLVATAPPRSTSDAEAAAEHWPTFSYAERSEREGVAAERPWRASRDSTDEIRTPLTEAMRILGLSERRAELAPSRLATRERMSRRAKSAVVTAPTRLPDRGGVQFEFEVSAPEPDPVVGVVAPLSDSFGVIETDAAPLRLDDVSLAEASRSEADDSYVVESDTARIRGFPAPTAERSSLDLALPTETDATALLHQSPSQLEAWRSFVLLLWQAVRELPPIPLAVWWGGGLVVLVVSLARAARTRMLVERATAAPSDVGRLVAEVAAQMNLRRAPQALMTPRRISPMVWCGRQPRLVLPAELWDELDDAGRRVVISHELAHLKRRDHWVCWFDLVAACAYWWHPLVWWVRSKLHEEADLACDAWVTAMLSTDRTIYAKTLLRTKVFASATTSAIPTMDLGMSRTRTKKFARRLTMVMTHKKTPNRTLAGLALASVVAAAGWLATPTMATSAPGEDMEPAPTARLIEAIAALAISDESDATPPIRPLPTAAPPAPSAPDAPEFPMVAAVPAASAAPAVPAVNVSGIADAIAMATVTAGDDDVEERLDALEDRLDRLMDLLEDRLFEEEDAWDDDDDWHEEEEWEEHERDWDADELIVLEYHMPHGKLGALTELMIRDDVPVLVSPHDDFIEVHGTPDQHHVFAMFVKMIAPDARVPEEFLHCCEHGEHGHAEHEREHAEHDMPERYRREAEKHEREAARFEQRMVELDHHAATLREEHEIILMQAEEVLAHAEDIHMRAEEIEDEASEIEEQVEELEQVVRSMQGDVRHAATNLLNEMLARHEAMLHEAEEHHRMAGNMEREVEHLERRAEAIERKLEAIYAEMEELEDHFDRVSAAFEDRAIELTLVGEAAIGCEAACSTTASSCAVKTGGATCASSCSVKTGGAASEATCTSEKKSCETKTESKGSAVKVFDNSDWVEVAEVEDAA